MPRIRSISLSAIWMNLNFLLFWGWYKKNSGCIEHGNCGLLRFGIRRIVRSPERWSYVRCERYGEDEYDRFCSRELLFNRTRITSLRRHSSLPTCKFSLFSMHQIEPGLEGNTDFRKKSQKFRSQPAFLGGKSCGDILPVPYVGWEWITGYWIRRNCWNWSSYTPLRIHIL